MSDPLWQVMSEGAAIVTPDVLQPSDVLLDLYGEDIRARAYVTQDPVLGEMMLRPDFTVPIVQAHMAGGVEPARYAYQGKVWRKQNATSQRPREYAQIGFEVFDSSDPATADAEVFDRVIRALSKTVDANAMKVTVGDVALMRGAVASLETSQLRKGALMRHLWRPARFNRLIARYAGELDLPVGRETLPKASVLQAIIAAGPEIGLRSAADVATRIDRLVEDRTQPKIPEKQIAALRSLQSLDVPLDQAVDEIAPLATHLPQLSGAADRLKATSDALSAKNIDLTRISFQGTYGLTAMEYYDGFVFGISIEDRLVATGGRYDALTDVLGDGSKMAAVGAVIRPDLLVEAVT
ncbi:MAG: ATP phosphoribosyltransferase regulatory subunit [Pseudomonadota bacterium]